MSRKQAAEYVTDRKVESKKWGLWENSMDFEIFGISRAVLGGMHRYVRALMTELTANLLVRFRQGRGSDSARTAVCHKERGRYPSPALDSDFLLTSLHQHVQLASPGDRRPRRAISILRNYHISAAR